MTHVYPFSSCVHTFLLRCTLKREREKPFIPTGRTTKRKLLTPKLYVSRAFLCCGPFQRSLQTKNNWIFFGWATGTWSAGERAHYWLQKWACVCVCCVHFENNTGRVVNINQSSHTLCGRHIKCKDRAVYCTWLSRRFWRAHKLACNVCVLFARSVGRSQCDTVRYNEAMAAFLHSR